MQLRFNEYLCVRCMRTDIDKTNYKCFIFVTNLNTEPLNYFSALLERVLLRIGSAETDEQLQSVVSKFLPPVLLKLSSQQEGVRKKVVLFCRESN